jgi:hypothetical protein
LVEICLADAILPLYFFFCGFGASDAEEAGSFNLLFELLGAGM